MKNALEGIENRADQMEERISKLNLGKELYIQAHKANRTP